MTTLTRGPSARPWYVYGPLVEEYKRIGREGGNLRMIQSLKVLKAIITNVLVAGTAIYAIMEGADPTLAGGLAITALGLINGIDLGEWIAAKRAIEELGTDDDVDRFRDEDVDRDRYRDAPRDDPRDD